MTAIDLFQSSYSRGLVSDRASASRTSSETVVCDACGCRLTTSTSADDADFGGPRRWFHYAGAAGRDARGCAVACADAPHDIA